MRYLYFLLLLLCSIQAYPQFIGGNADGAGYTALTQGACASLPSYNFSYGGNADGFSFNTLTQGACASLPSYNFSYGGNADGFSFNTLTQGVCASLPSYNFSYGGNADGFSFNTLTQGACASLPSYNFSYGGNADGFTYNVLTQAVCPPVASTIFYVYGGSADGSANNILTQTSCTPLTSYTFSYGGSADGFSYNTFSQTSCAALTSYTFNYGGSSDGFSNNKLTQTSCAALTDYTFYRGSSGDGQFSTACGCGTCISLPIQLLSFTATLQSNNTVLCKWQTASEINNDYFTIEKTKDDRQYEFVGQVKGAGNSSITLNYALIDTRPFQGTSYYRLKQTDYDGKYKYSDLVPVNLKGINIISIAPNPAVDEFEYKIGSTEKMSLQVKVVDILGQIIINTTENIEQGITQKRLDVSALSSGTYILQLITENKEVRGKQFQIK